MTTPQDQLGSYEGYTMDALGALTDTQLDVRRPDPQRNWKQQFTTSHPCHVCGTESVAVEDEGWVCADHRTNSADREGTGESIPSSG